MWVRVDFALVGMQAIVRSSAQMDFSYLHFDGLSQLTRYTLHYSVLEEFASETELLK